MKISALKTIKINPSNPENLFAVLDEYLIHLDEGSVLAVTSKIVAICEGRVVKIGEAIKKDLIRAEAEYFLPPEESKYNITLTLKNNLLIPTAGIDESNGDGYYILWPSDPQKSANAIRQYLVTRFSLEKMGVVITDSRTSPLRWGTTGVAIAHSGFSALNNYIGKPDIFGQPLKVTKANIMDALAVAAVVVMGEANEQTPLTVIDDIPFVDFQPRDPTSQELEDLHIAMEDDLYAALFKGVPWIKGGK